VQQAASGGSHVTIYEANVEFVSGSPAVHVFGLEPEDAEPGCFQQATESIRRGAEQVLGPFGLRRRNLHSSNVLHPIDFNPHQFERYTGRRTEASGGRKPSDKGSAAAAATVTDLPRLGVAAVGAAAELGRSTAGVERDAAQAMKSRA